MKPAAETVFHNGPILVDGRLRDGLAVVVSNGTIKRIAPGSDRGQTDGDRVDLDGRWLLPGFIDTQVNGGGGVLFNDAPTPEGVAAIAAAHRPFGTTGLLPTLISDTLEVVESGLNAVQTAIGQHVPGVIGIHIEGPFLCPERRGVHDVRRIRRLDAETLNRLQPLNNGVTLITVAPDQVAPSMVRELVAKGFIVSAGHSNASFEQVAAAAEEGLRGFTHLYNAMSQMTAREPGVVGAALALDDTWCGLIADGHHVAPASVEIAWRCKGKERLMLVSDAMPNAGTDMREFTLQGKRVLVEGGVCRDESGTLAGADLDLGAAVRNMIAMTGCSAADAVTMASSTPAEFLGLAQERGAIAIGRRADFVVTDPDLNVLATYIAGEAA